MGIQHCCGSNPVKVVATIPDPTGDPLDPLLSKGDILQEITHDPHINYFKNQIQGVMMPLSKQGKRITRKDQIPFATTDKKQYESYIQYVNNSLAGNQLSTTNVLSFLFKQIADIREQEEVQTKFKDEKYAALKCFIYLYTGKYAYKKVNQSLRANEHHRLAPVIGLIKKELKMFSKQNSSLANRKIGLLYRGIDIRDPLMVQKSRIYWKGFTSTTLNKEVVKQFGRYQYTIALKRELTHDYLIIPKELSHFQEEQVLIFPYFYFEVTKVKTFKANKTENYDIIQLAPEIDKQEDDTNLRETAQINENSLIHTAQTK